MICICVTKARAKSSFYWSVMHYQVTFEWHSGRGSETIIMKAI